MINKNELELLYENTNLKSLIHPDPLEFVWNYSSLKDREIVALIASSLAYGQVRQILKSVSSLLDKMGDSPYDFLMNPDSSHISDVVCGFCHRFCREGDMELFLLATRRIIMEYGSLDNAFGRNIGDSDKNVLPGLMGFYNLFAENGFPPGNHLFPNPAKGSALKRLNLFLRWMVRKDNVDPGGWKSADPSMLVIPLDVHMHRICLEMGLTKRKGANMKTALEITEAFKSISPDDPVKYDFSLTRGGIRGNYFLKENSG